MRNVISACIRRDFGIARSYRLAFALQLLAVLSTLAIFAGVSKVVDTRQLTRESGVSGDYLAFASIGIAITGVLTVMCSAFARRVREDQTTGVFEAMLATPADPRLLVIAGAAYEVGRALVMALLTILVSVVVFGVDLTFQGKTALALVVAFPALLAVLASVGIVVAAAGVVYKDPGALVVLAASGVALISGAYFPVSVLPDPFPAIARVVPFTWGLDTLRGALLDGHVAVWKCFGLLVVGAFALPASLAIYRRAVDVARRRGSLGLY